MTDERSDGEGDAERKRALREAIRAAQPRAGPGQPRRIDRFVLVGRLGKGAMGVVYEAYDEKLSRGVAVKVLRKQKNPTGEARLRREAQALARLSHPNVVPIYEVGSTEAGLYLVMELVRGKALSDWAAAGCTPTDLLARLAEAARGLGAAHEVGVVHRDVKPENILVGEDGRARVLDFGLARYDEEAEATGAGSERPLDVAITQDGAAVGTPLYMSPEQFEGAGVGPLSDQWSLCATAYELLFGARPFAGDAYAALRAEVLEGALRPPPPSEVPAGAARAVLRGLSRRPRDRFPSMAALAEELERHAGRADLDPTSARRARAAAAGILFFANLGSIAVLAQRPPPYYTPELLVRSPLSGALGFGLIALLLRRRILATARQQNLLGTLFLSWVGMVFHRVLSVRMALPVLDTLVAEAFAFAGALTFAGLVLDRSLLLTVPICLGFVGVAALSPTVAPLAFPVMLGLVLFVAVLSWRAAPRLMASGGPGGPRSRPGLLPGSEEGP